MNSLASIIKLLTVANNALDGLDELVKSRQPPALAAPDSDLPADGSDIAYKEGQFQVVRGHGGTIDQRVARIIRMARAGKRSARIQLLTAKTLNRKCNGEWCIAEKDHPKEIKAIFAMIRSKMRYMSDPRGVDTFRHPVRSIDDFNGGDCFVRGTLVLNDSHQLVPIESLRVGDKIWGRDRWSTVTKIWQKGILPTWRIKLNNGSPMRLTPSHKVWVASCDRHSKSKDGCSCRVAERRVHRITVRELRTGMVVLPGERVPFGKGELDAGRAYVEGLYLADGWHEGTRFSISGKDGHPKEAQKKRVEEICAALGISTKMSKKHIRIKDPEWTARVATMGSHAPQKHALSIDLTEGPALRMLEGIMADSGRNTHGRGRTFTTTSRELFLQTRVLLKMAGVTCSERYIVDHGGLGTNPIWRLQTRDNARPDGKAEKLLTVKGILRDDLALPCVDIETDDHYVWLPEADWVTSQCDDFTSALAACLEAAGFTTMVRVVAIKPAAPKAYGHILVLCGLPQRSPSKMIPLPLVPLDASVSMKPGWYPKERISGYKDFPVPA